LGQLDRQADGGAEVVAIDGKALRGTREGGKKTLVHMVSAWANSNNLVLGQQRVDEKSNEIIAIPKLLMVLELRGTTVTIDAVGCQKSIAQQNLDKQADYILAAKENQLHLLEDMRDSFKNAAPGIGRRRGGLRPWARGDPPLLGTGRPVAGRAGCRLASFAKSCAHRGRTLSQGHRKNRTRDPLLYLQFAARGGAA
jgi:hypothetical protein